MSIALIGCGGEATATPSPSPGPSATGSPTATPTASPGTSAGPSASVGPGAIAIDSIALVVTDELRVRSLPGVSDESKLLTPLLDSGREVFVIAGPVAASGFDWYQVQPVGDSGAFGDFPLGWVAAAGKDGEQWLAGDRFECPPLPADYRAFLALHPIVAVACFGDREITFAARIVAEEEICGIEVGWRIDPDWFAPDCAPPFYLADPTSPDADLTWSPVFHPILDVTDLRAGMEPGDRIDVVVTGHHDDPNAQRCEGVALDPSVEVPISRERAVLECRSQFALTSIETGGIP